MQNAAPQARARRPRPSRLKRHLLYQRQGRRARSRGVLLPVPVRLPEVLALVKFQLITSEALAAVALKNSASAAVIGRMRFMAKVSRNSTVVRFNSA